MNIKIRKAKRRDVRKLSGRLRDADAQEVLAAGNETVEAALTYSFEKSLFCFCVEVEGTPAALFGIIPETILGDQANIWLLGAPEMARIKKSFVKLSRQVVKEWLVCYPLLWNVVPCWYTQAIRWLEAMGAVFDEGSAVPGFRRFSIRRA